mgnify:CR=1 FL=1
MSTLKENLYKKIEAHRPRTTSLLKKHGDVKIGDVTIAQAIGGARGVRCLVTDISYLDPNECIRFRGKTIPETFAALPAVAQNVGGRIFEDRDGDGLRDVLDPRMKQ